jgi:hypothetical protein
MQKVTTKILIEDFIAILSIMNVLYTFPEQRDEVLIIDPVINLNI